jgi:hypothetical protein
VNLDTLGSNEYVKVSVVWYIYIGTLKAELIVHYDYQFSDNLSHMPHVTFILHDQTSHIHSFCLLILVISGGRYNLGSYTLCSFLHYPITSSHNSLRTDQHCCQTQSTAFPQCHRPKFTPPFMKISHTHTHTCLYFNSSIFRKQEGELKF